MEGARGARGEEKARKMEGRCMEWTEGVRSGISKREDLDVGE